jgi:hypothetical protein
MPQELSLMPLVLFWTKSAVAFQRPSSCATATAKAAITALVPSGLVQLIKACAPLL